MEGLGEGNEGWKELSFGPGAGKIHFQVGSGAEFWSWSREKTISRRDQGLSREKPLPRTDPGKVLDTCGASWASRNPWELLSATLSTSMGWDLGILE